VTTDPVPAADPPAAEPLAAAPPVGPERRYSGRVTAIIIVAIVAVFVVLNVFVVRLLPEPEDPVQRPVVTQRATPAG
jgi:hypothetical protein